MFVPLPVLVALGLLLIVLLIAVLRKGRRQDDLIRPPFRANGAAARPLDRVVERRVVSATLPSDIQARIVDLLRADEVIVAIKLVRETTGLGLKASKDMVDEMRRSGLRNDDPFGTS